MNYQLNDLSSFICFYGTVAPCSFHRVVCQRTDTRQVDLMFGEGHLPCWEQSFACLFDQGLVSGFRLWSERESLGGDRLVRELNVSCH